MNKTRLAASTIALALLLAASTTISCAFVKPRQAPYGVELERARNQNPAVLAEVQERLEAGEADAFVAMDGERVIMEWGDADKLMNCASVRKSLISVLYGIAADKGMIDLDASLAELGIDDEKSPLTDVERTATVRDLLESRSGIYIRAQGENQGMIDRRPERGDDKPGERFYYNNWGFNVLGTIFEQETGMPIGAAFEDWLARPLGMTGFDPSHVIYSGAPYTSHRMYRFYLSASDLARVGVLFIQEGRWGGRQVVPASWIEDSVKPHSRIERGIYDGYGYLWWLDLDEGTVWADGSGGQYMLIDRARGLVLVSRNYTGITPIEVGLYQRFGVDAPQQELIGIHHLMIAGDE